MTQSISPKGWTPCTISHRFASTAPQSYDKTSHSCEVVVSTGAPVTRIYGTEVLRITLEAVDLSRVPCPVLDSHSQASVSDVLGRIDRTWITNGQLLGRNCFAQTPRGKLVEGMVERGEIVAMSAGYRVLEWEVVDADGDAVDPARARWDDGLTFTATRWQLLESSWVGIPADSLALVRSLHSDNDNSSSAAYALHRMQTRERMVRRQRMHDRSSESQ